MTAPGAPFGSAGDLPPINSLADEAAQLLDAVAARLTLVRVALGDRGPGSDPSPGDPAVEGIPTEAAQDSAEPMPAPATGHPQCVGWCPVCRSADLLRGERPEVAGKLVDSAMVVIGVLRSLLPPTPATDRPSTGSPTAGRSTPGPTAPDQSSDASAAGPAATTGRPGGTPPPPGIERIDIR